jgi:hypothetical protein
MKPWRWNTKFRRDERVQPTVRYSLVKPTAATAERQHIAACGRCDTSSQTFWPTCGLCNDFSMGRVGWAVEPWASKKSLLEVRTVNAHSQRHRCRGMRETACGNCNSDWKC